MDHPLGSCGASESHGSLNFTYYGSDIHRVQTPIGWRGIETLSRFVIRRAHAAFTEEASGRAIGGIFGSGPQDIEIFLGIHWIN